MAEASEIQNPDLYRMIGNAIGRFLSYDPYLQTKSRNEVQTIDEYNNLPSTKHDFNNPIPNIKIHATSPNTPTKTLKKNKPKPKNTSKNSEKPTTKPKKKSQPTLVQQTNSTLDQLFNDDENTVNPSIFIDDYSSQFGTPTEAGLIPFLLENPASPVDKVIQSRLDELTNADTVKIEDLKNYRDDLDGRYEQLNIKPLLSYADSRIGTRLAQDYTPPKDFQQRLLEKKKLDAEIWEAQERSKNNLISLRERLAAQAELARDRNETQRVLGTILEEGRNQRNTLDNRTRLQAVNKQTAAQIKAAEIRAAAAEKNSKNKAFGALSPEEQADVKKAWAAQNVKMLQDHYMTTKYPKNTPIYKKIDGGLPSSRAMELLQEAADGVAAYTIKNGGTFYDNSKMIMDALKQRINDELAKSKPKK